MTDDLLALYPFAGLPWPVQILFVVAFVLSVIQILLVIGLSLLASREEAPSSETNDESRFLWVFVVPALDEEVTIADTVARLELVQVTHRRILVIDDGSSDRTSEILAEHASPDLQVLTRVPPDARKGKAAALNHAWRVLRDDPVVGEQSEFGEERTLVVIVDADGRLDPGLGADVASRFLDDRVGGVQLAVRIYNRAKPLAYMQDIEFRIFGSVFQMGRSAWGTAGMGGNGQVNRLAALTEIAQINMAGGQADGPWRHRLTEDQDLGLSLIGTGWLGQEEMHCAVNQQGLSSYRRLFRQRVRWCQGNMQAMARVGVFRRAPIRAVARLDGSYWLLQPVVQTVIAISTMTAAVLLVFFPDLVDRGIGVVTFLALLILAFGGTSVGVFRAERVTGRGNPIRSLLLVIPYIVYCWSLLPIYAVAWYRQIVRRDDWAKTAREAIG